MDLPVIFPELKDQRYDCEQCGQGCRELVVYLTDRDRRKIDQQGWSARLSIPPYIRFGRSNVLNHTPKEECVFLAPDNLCRIHTEFGYTEKPLSCQIFPFSIEPQKRGYQVTVRFDCPAVAKSVGSSLGKHRQDVLRLAAALKSAGVAELDPPTAPVKLVEDRPLSESEVETINAGLEKWLGDTSRPLPERLAGLENLINTLATAKVERLDGTQLIDFIGMLIADLPAAVAEFDLAQLAPPSGRQQRLFRLSVFAHCESVRLKEACGGMVARWRYKFDQLRRARRLAAGQGLLPVLVRGHVGGTFENLLGVKPAEELTPEAIDQLLTRYLRARLLGYSVFGHGYYGWTVLDGLRALLQTVAVTGWVMRYLAVSSGRSRFDYADAVRALGIVDRHATRSPELGMRSARMRLRYIAENHGLLRLAKMHYVL